jgi:hypothetical protein
MTCDKLKSVFARVQHDQFLGIFGKLSIVFAMNPLSLISIMVVEFIASKWN